MPADDKKDEKVDKKDDKEKIELKEEDWMTPQQKIFKSIRDNISLIEKSVEQHEPRLVMRVLRSDNKLRKQLSKTILKTIAEQYNPDILTFFADLPDEDSNGSAEGEVVLSLKRMLSPPIPTKHLSTTTTEGSMDIEKKKDEPSSEKPGSTPAAAPELLPEVKAYIHHLLVLKFIDKQLFDDAALCSSELFSYIHQFNRRSMDWLSAKIYFYYDFSHASIKQLDRIRNSLLIAHRTACLQHNEPGQAALTVSILKNYIHYNLYSAADAFRSKTSFPEQRSTALLVRYLYYTGKINTVQLHYSDAYSSLSQALRKAPQKTALGFRLTVTKLLVIVQLLMGEIPDRSTFSQHDMKKPLFPYLQLTRAVRVGDLSSFMSLQNRYRGAFEKDGLTHLIMRLRHHVIKAGLRKINIAYSAITIKDIAEKLHLDSVEDAESIVVKAIGDGVMEASIDHSTGVVQSKETGDVYGTTEPQAAFHKRIQFCIDIHNDAVKAMHFPPNAHKFMKNGLDEDEDEEDEEGNIREKTKSEEDEKKEKKDEKKDADKDKKK